MEDWSVSLFRLGFSVCGSYVDTERISVYIIGIEREREIKPRRRIALAKRD